MEVAVQALLTGTACKGLERELPSCATERVTKIVHVHTGHSLAVSYVSFRSKVHSLTSSQGLGISRL